MKKKITFGYTKCAKDLTFLKKEKKFLKEVDSIPLQQALRYLDTAGFLRAVALKLIRKKQNLQSKF